MKTFKIETNPGGLWFPTEKADLLNPKEGEELGDYITVENGLDLARARDYFRWEADRLDRMYTDAFFAFQDAQEEVERLRLEVANLTLELQNR